MSSRRGIQRPRRSRPRRSRGGPNASSASAVTGGIGRSLINRNQSVPTRLRVKVGYNEQVTVVPGSGSSDGYVINLQSMYDPRFASGGHQPQYFDQLMAIWTYFVVRAVTIRVTLAPDHDVMTSGSGSATSVYQGASFIAPYTNTSGTRPSAAASDMLEWPGCITQPTVTNGSGSVIVLRIDIPKLVGLTWNQIKANPAFWGTNGGNPSTMIAFAFAGAVAQAAGQPPPLLGQISMVYEAEIFMPQTVTAS